LALIALLASSGAQAQTCVGDCNGNGMVGINELVLGVNISLGLQSVSACEAFDCQNNGMVGINCLIQGVNNSLLGCGPHPTPTATPPGGQTPTPSGGTTRTFTLGNNILRGRRLLRCELRQPDGRRRSVHGQRSVSEWPGMRARTDVEPHGPLQRLAARQHQRRGHVHVGPAHAAARPARLDGRCTSQAAE
jgi:hypothetical protein